MVQMRRLGKRGGVVPKHFLRSRILGSSSCREKNPPFKNSIAIFFWPTSFGANPSIASVFLKSQSRSQESKKW
jgi:hypothetical protein